MRGYIIHLSGMRVMGWFAICYEYNVQPGHKLRIIIDIDVPFRCWPLTTVREPVYTVRSRENPYGSNDPALLSPSMVTPNHKDARENNVADAQVMAAADTMAGQCFCVSSLR